MLQLIDLAVLYFSLKQFPTVYSIMKSEIQITKLKYKIEINY